MDAEAPTFKHLLQSTSLLRGKTSLFRWNHYDRNASIHFPLAREDFAYIVIITIINASIHFPLAREDCNPAKHQYHKHRFNPLPSCEGRLSEDKTYMQTIPLQSTSLLRGKTLCPGHFRMPEGCFNPLPSCEGRQILLPTGHNSCKLQSTSLLRGKT